MGDWSRVTVRNREDLIAWRYMVQDFEQRIGKNINEEADKQILKQAINMNKYTFNKYTRGDIPRISLRYFITYCKAFHIDSSKYFAGLAEAIENDMKKYPDEYK